jgi:hypothetical protein
MGDEKMDQLKWIQSASDDFAKDAVNNACCFNFEKYQQFLKTTLGDDEEY